ncbi:MAG: hypothetical protein KF718_24665 [Polyangiaceae bacterium]|nr:hypothetical protein [Polyangiaceae bacterium]
MPLPGSRSLLCVAVLLAACSRNEQAPTSASSAASPPPSSSPAPAPASAEPVAAEPAKPTVREDVPEAVPGATVTMATTSVDGLDMEKISCKGGSGLFAGVALLGALAKQKDALHGCVKSPEAVRVHVAFEGAKTDDVRVGGASTPEVASCVAAAVSEARFGSTGACALTMKLGPR